MGITDDNFQDEGNIPDFIERLKSLVTEGAILCVTILSILPVMPSGPQALVTSILLNRSVTSSTEQWISSVQDVKDCVDLFNCCSRGGYQGVKASGVNVLEEVSLFKVSMSSH